MGINIIQMLSNPPRNESVQQVTATQFCITMQNFGYPQIYKIIARELYAHLCKCNYNYNKYAIGLQNKNKLTLLLEKKPWFIEPNSSILWTTYMYI